VLAACLVLGMTWLTWQVRRELHFVPRDPVQRAYERLCRRMGGVGLARIPSEGPEAYACRVSQLRPDLAATVSALCRDYSTLRYGRGAGAAADAADGKRFLAAVRRFKPRGSRASS